MDSIEFYIDDKPYSTFKENQSLADVLAQAGLTADEVFLISSDGTKYKDANEIVKIFSGERFTTEKRDRDSGPERPKLIHYTVNGEQLTTDKETLSVEQILTSAGSAASIDLEKLNSYILENIKSLARYESLNDQVKIESGDQFIAVYSGATPVADFVA